MIGFKTNKIIEEKEAVGELLREAREEKKTSLKEAAAKLNINIKYLEALEKGMLSSLPPGVYTKNFLKEYSVFLGMDYKKIISLFEETGDMKKSEKKNLFQNQKVKKYNLIVFPKILKIFLIILIVSVFFVYLSFNIKKILEPPRLEILKPQNDYISNDHIINVFGYSDPEVQVFINGELIFLNHDGYFEKEINLKEGLNKIIITAEKKYGKNNIIERQVLFK